MRRRLLGVKDCKGVGREEGMRSSERQEGCKGVDGEEEMWRSERQEGG